MQTIPGVGAKTVRVLLAEFGDLSQYKRRELVALAGLFPVEHTSGTSVHKQARLAKGGRGQVRRYLYLCALSAIRYNPPLRAFAQRLRDNGKCGMQAVVAVMRKLLLVIRALIVSGQDFDPSFAQ
jgi:transposase